MAREEPGTDVGQSVTHGSDDWQLAFDGERDGGSGHAGLGEGCVRWKLRTG